ncbi:hypothetical protein MSEN_41980 [Mycolicibacter senuensis]|uniref:Uncharacterized protein n=1 Tax=Mycolicibacter senuensis TaxID=386913 RepID=A0A7I9XRR9_9MYCO|nr:hypothetical protein MSEN_41980 [Mycolicibacter senuensis]
MRSKLEVWAAEPADAVLWAGGLICDRALGGWDVVVLVPNPSDDRALDILGAEIRGRESHSTLPDLANPVVTIRVGSDDLDETPQVEYYVCGPLELDGYGFRHRLSAGARAFKAHALRAAGLEAEVATAEMFRPAHTAEAPTAHRHHGRIGRWPNVGQSNDASSTPGACC